MQHKNKGVAVEYSAEIPRIIARAKGELLEKLIQAAEENKITIYKDHDLTEALYNLDMGAEIPENLFKAVSRVLAYCYRINSDFKEKLKESGIYKR